MQDFCWFSSLELAPEGLDELQDLSRDVQDQDSWPQDGLCYNAKQDFKLVSPGTETSYLELSLALSFSHPRAALH